MRVPIFKRGTRPVPCPTTDDVTLVVLSPRVSMGDTETVVLYSDPRCRRSSSEDGGRSRGEVTPNERSMRVRGSLPTSEMGYPERRLDDTLPGYVVLSGVYTPCRFLYSRSRLV